MFLEDSVIDADLAEPYQIVRSVNGEFALGGFTATTQKIAAFGVVSMAKAREIEMLAEGDRDTEARAFYSTQPLYVTRDNAQEGTGQSDILVWNNVNYRVVAVMNYQNRGYYKAIAVRMTAS